jgi:hypothetical protein
MIGRACFLLSFTLCTVSAAPATEDYNAIFEQAVNAIEFNFDENWAYTETRVDSEHVWVGRFDPRRPSSEMWRLHSVDKRPPTNEEIEEYLGDKARDHHRSGDKRVNEMVEPDTIVLIEETDEHWLLGFQPGEDEKEFMDSVDATIRIKKPAAYLEYIDIRSHSPIKPAIGVKISKLITRLTFGPAADDGPVVPISTQVEVKGRAYLVVSFDEEELVRNSDFEYAGGE